MKNITILGILLFLFVLIIPSVSALEITPVMNTEMTSGSQQLGYILINATNETYDNIKISLSGIPFDTAILPNNFPISNETKNVSVNIDVSQNALPLNYTGTVYVISDGEIYDFDFISSLQETYNFSINVSDIQLFLETEERGVFEINITNTGNSPVNISVTKKKDLGIFTFSPFVVVYPYITLPFLIYYNVPDTIGNDDYTQKMTFEGFNQSYNITMQISITDKTPPKIEADFKEELDALEYQNITVKASDNSDVGSLTMEVEAPDGSRSNYTDFIVDQTGLWKIRASAIDIYNNTAEKEWNFTVNKISPINVTDVIDMGQTGINRFRKYPFFSTDVPVDINVTLSNLVFENNTFTGEILILNNPMEVNETMTIRNFVGDLEYYMKSNSTGQLFAYFSFDFSDYVESSRTDTLVRTLFVDKPLLFDTNITILGRIHQCIANNTEFIYTCTFNTSGELDLYDYNFPYSKEQFDDFVSSKDAIITEKAKSIDSLSFWGLIYIVVIVILIIVLVFYAFIYPRIDIG